MVRGPTRAVWGFRAMGILLIVFVVYLTLHFAHIGHKPSAFLQAAASKLGKFQFKIGPNLDSSLRQRILSWRASYVLLQLDGDDDPEFLSLVDEIRRQKIAADDNREFWDCDPSLELPLRVALPETYANPQKERPPLQPFDPRLTIGIYLKYIEQQKRSGQPLTAPFHWSDWTDLLKTFRYLDPHQDDKICEKLFDISNQGIAQSLDLKDVRSYCRKTNLVLGFEVYSPPLRHTEHAVELAGKVHLLISQPSPHKLVFLTNAEIDSPYEVEVNTPENNFRNGITHNGLPESLVVDSQDINPLEIYNGLIERYPPTRRLHTNDFVKLEPRDFEVEPTEILRELESLENLDPAQEAYYELVKYLHAEEAPPKYFYEANLLKLISGYALGDHYDWRFFRGLTHALATQEAALHRLVKNYLNFVRQVGIRTWIAHGSLLLWYWNGMLFPWDEDIDVQMPVRDLYQLCRHYNQLMIIENVGDNQRQFDGFGRYFVDCGLTITHRGHENGKNNIDARFIDVDTGIYIDITGLAVTGEVQPHRYDEMLSPKDAQTSPMERNSKLHFYNCRNRHFVQLHEVLPLVPVIIENQVGYVPHDIISPLVAEYGLDSIMNRKFKKYEFNVELRQWIPLEKIKQYLRDPVAWQTKHKVTLGEGVDSIPPQVGGTNIAEEDWALALEGLGKTDILNLAKDLTIFREYFKPRQFTKYHQEEVTRIVRESYQEHFAALHQFTTDNPTIGLGLEPDGYMTKLLQEGESLNDAHHEVLKMYSSE